MKIAVVAPTEIPAKRANTIQVLKMTQALNRLGHQTRLVSPFDPQKGKPVCDWNLLANHYGLQEKLTLDWLPAHPLFRSYDYSLRSIFWARTIHAEVLYTRLPQTAAFASMIGFPTVLEIHDYPQARMGKFLFRLFLLGKGKKKLVTITRALKKDLSNLFEIINDNQFTVVAPDGVDLQRYENLPTPMEARKIAFVNLSKVDINKVNSAKIMAGYTGHLYAGRGINFILQLAKNLPETVFLIVGGEKDDVQILNEKIKQLNIKNIIVTGFIPNAELPTYQAACDFLLMPYQSQIAASSGGDISKYLSPMKLFEYLATGRPIISSDLPVLREILNEDNAILLPHNKPEIWIREIQKLTQDPKRQKEIAENAKHDSLAYSWDKRAQLIFGNID
jgi:glycosyltransferase involved in cell wall biosynthesis